MGAGHLMTDTVTYAPVTDRSNGGQAVYGSQVPIPARVDEGSFKVTGPDGVERVGGHRVTSETEIPTNARVWLPDDDTSDNNTSRRVIGRKKSRVPQTGYELHETVF